MTRNTRTEAPPFSLRLTLDERAKLERDAAGQAVSVYVRHMLFGDQPVPRRRAPKKKASVDQVALSRLLAALGASRLSQNLNQLAKAVNTGSLPVTPETERDLKDACQAVVLIRADLMRALGASAGGEP